MIKNVTLSVLRNRSYRLLLLLLLLLPCRTAYGQTTHTIRVTSSTTGVTVGSPVEDLYETTIPISLPANGTTAALTIDIGSGAAGWTAREASDPTNFLSASPASGTGDGTLTITYSASTTFAPRTATITLWTTGGSGTAITRTLSLTQAAGSPCNLPTCFVGDITLNSKEDITDAIKAYTHIGGNLTIGDGNEGTNISNADLQGLSVQEITGTLSINWTKLTELNAFASLSSVGGNLQIGDYPSGNARLTSVSGFASLSSVGGGLSIWHNARLTSVSGFGMLSSVGGGLSVGLNAALTSVSGFGMLSSIGGNLSIRVNSVLTSVSGFTALSSVGGALQIFDNSVLTSLPSFASLSSVGGGLSIGSNSRLTSLPSFPALRSIGSELALSAIPIYIRNNQLLSTCCGVFPFLQASLPTGFTLGGTGTPDISGNKAGCNTVQQIRNGGGCQTISVSTTTTGVTVSGNNISLPANGNTAALTIDIGSGAAGWTATVSNPAGFLSASPASGTGDGTLTITYSASTTFVPRTATITLSTTGANGSPITKTLSLTQAAGRECNLPTCFVGNIMLNSKEDITDAIKAYTHIGGNLSIGDGYEGTDIANADLQGLSVQEITGDLKIISTKLATLNAFASLRSIGSGLSSTQTPITITNNRRLSVCCGVFAFLQSPRSPDYTLGGSSTPSISGNKAGCASVQQIRSGGVCQTISVSTTTTDVTVSADDGTTIPISLPANGTTAALTIDIGGGAAGWTATEADDPTNFLSDVTASGTGDGTLTINYSANTSPFPRTATITLSTTGGTGTPITRTLSLTQAAGRACNLPTCFVGDITLNSKEDITDAIKAYTHIGGNVTIGDAATGTDIANADLQACLCRRLRGTCG